MTTKIHFFFFFFIINFDFTDKGSNKSISIDSFTLDFSSQRGIEKKFPVLSDSWTVYIGT